MTNIKLIPNNRGVLNDRDRAYARLRETMYKSLLESIPGTRLDRKGVLWTR